MADEPLIIFIHSLKTGGTTLRDILVRQYDEGAVLSVSRHGDLRSFRDRNRAQLATARAVQGHMSIGLHRLIDRPSTYITLVRDPVDRLLSLFYFANQRPTRAISRESDAYLGSLEAFVTSPDLAEVDNEQTRRLSGLWPEVGACTPAMLDTAKDNLRTQFAVIGVTERFDESLMLMRRLFGWRDPFYLKRKVTRRRPARESVPPTLVDVIEQRNQLDRRLYEYAVERLEVALGEQDATFESELRTFRVINAELANRPSRRPSPVAPSPTPELVAMLVSAHATSLERAHDFGEVATRSTVSPTLRTLLSHAWASARERSTSLAPAAKLKLLANQARDWAAARRLKWSLSTKRSPSRPNRTG